MNQRSKKFYSQPKVERYGRISDLTAAGSPFPVAETGSQGSMKQRP